MKKKLNLKNVLFIGIILMTAVNVFVYPEQAAASIVAGVMVCVLYRLSGDNWRKFLYFCIILFASMAITFVVPLGSRYGIHHFYFLLFIYMADYVVNLFRKNSIGEIFKGVLHNRYMLFISVFLIYVLFTIVFAGDKKNVVSSFITYGVMFCLLLVNVFENRNFEDIKLSSKAFAFIYSIILAIGTLEIFNIRLGMRTHYNDKSLAYTIYNFPELRKVPITFFYNQNNYGVLMALAMVILVIVYVYAKKKSHKIIIAVLFALSQINLIFTSCRTAWITIFLVMFMYFIISLFSHNKELRKVVLKFTAAIIVIFIAFAIIPYSRGFYGQLSRTPIIGKLLAGNYQQTEVLKLGAPGGDNERITIIYDIFKGVFKEKHILGLGAGNSEDYLRKANNTNGIYSVHFYWFEILGEFGIAIFIYTMYAYIRLLLDLYGRYKKSDRGSVYSECALLSGGALFAFIFLGIAPSSLNAYVPFWIMLGFAGAVINSRKLSF